MSDVEPNRSTLLRDCAAIVLTGVALGLAFNAIGLAEKPPRGLPWMGGDRPMESAERVISSVPTPPAASARPGPALARIPSPRHESALVGPPSRESGVPRERSTSSDLPTIPDVGRPLEASRATVAAFVAAEAALLVDAREPSAFAAGHIPGAVNVPYEDATRDPARLRALDPKERPIIVYCSGGDCEASKELADLMVRDFGMRRVLVYRGGFPDWEAAGQPVSRSAP